jgi:hypothetical protein
MSDKEYIHVKFEVWELRQVIWLSYLKTWDVLVSDVFTYSLRPAT